jgi:NAD(P)-dependent dehydrogenase (short-subunit alcohol dehydrogenase family)/acyl carrier protein
MARAKHIGKVAIGIKDGEARIIPTIDRKAITIRAEGTYLITGGLGGLGLSLAQWLVEQGARHLVLVGRRSPSEAAETAIQAMVQTGARVQCVQADVSREGDVEKLFAVIRKELPPVSGIVHAAMVLDDHMLLEQSEDSFRKVYGPKALGAWNLHKFSAGLELDFFVMYSSAAGLVGSPGQANYCASNAYLDALCRERTRRGLPGMSIQWGAFADVGVAAAQDNRGQRLSYRGGASLSPAEGLEALQRLLKNPRPEVGIARFDGRKWVEFYPSTAGVPFFAEVLKQDKLSESMDSRARVIPNLLQMARPDERLAILEKHVSEQVGAILRLDPLRIDHTTPFTAMGMDSLMSLELRNRLEASLGLRLSSTILFKYTTIAALSPMLLSELGHDLATPEPTAITTVVEPENGFERSVEEMSEEEAEAMLLAKLAAMGAQEGNWS